MFYFIFKEDQRWKNTRLGLHFFVLVQTWTDTDSIFLENVQYNRTLWMYQCVRNAYNLLRIIEQEQKCYCHRKANSDRRQIVECFKNKLLWDRVFEYSLFFVFIFFPLYVRLHSCPRRNEPDFILKFKAVAWARLSN